MINQVYVVRDSKAGAFLRPFFTPTEGLALRAISDALDDSSSDFFRHAQDYDLYRLGSYDDACGKFSLLNAPEHMFNLAQFRDPTEEVL